MSGPKHLWSGDWERESADASKRLPGHRPEPAAPPPQDPEPAPAAKPRPRQVRRPAVRVTRPRVPRVPRVVPIALAAVLVLAAGALALTSLLGSSSPSRPVAGPPAPLPASTPAGSASRPVRWLGMELVTVSPGVAVVETVAPGSPGDRAGLSPGDAIVEINNRPITGTDGIAPAIRGLHAGDRVPLQVTYGSGGFDTEATLAAPPSAYP